MFPDRQSSIDRMSIVPVRGLGTRRVKPRGRRLWFGSPGRARQVASAAIRTSGEASADTHAKAGRGARRRCNRARPGVRWFWRARIRPRVRRQSAKIRLRCAGRGDGRRPEGLSVDRFSTGRTSSRSRRTTGLPSWHFPRNPHRNTAARGELCYAAVIRST
jgi:hypothetical protein